MNEKFENLNLLTEIKNRETTEIKNRETREYETFKLRSGQFVDVFDKSSSLGEELPVIETSDGQRVVVKTLSGEEETSYLFMVAPTALQEGVEFFDPSKPEILMNENKAEIEVKNSISAWKKIKKFPQKAVHPIFRFLNKKDPTYINRFVLFNGLAVGAAMTSWITRRISNPWNPVPHWDKVADIFCMNMYSFSNVPTYSRLNPAFYFFELGKMLKEQKVVRDSTINNARISAGVPALLWAGIEMAGMTGTTDPLDALAYGVGSLEAYWTNKQLIRRFQEGRSKTITEKIKEFLDERLASDISRDIGFDGIDDLVEFMADPKITDEEKKMVSKKVLALYKNLLGDCIQIAKENSKDIAGTLGNDTEAEKHYKSLIRHLSALVLRSHIKDLLEYHSAVDQDYWKSAVSKKEGLKEKALYQYRVSL